MRLDVLVRISLPGVVLGLVMSATGFAAGNQGVKELSVASHATVTPVIELYTSEGCSSCPRADQFLSELGDTLDHDFHAIPLAFHVDYWNWLGWEDPYSKAEFTERQRKIGRLNQQSSIYTPEFVVAGKESRGGQDIVERIKSSNAQAATVAIDLNIKVGGAEELIVGFVVDNMNAEESVLAHIAIYENHIVREIGAGENSGRTLTHNFVVRHWSDAIKLPRGQTNRMLSLEIDETWEAENLGMALIVVDPETGETLQAVSTALDTLFQI
jgi:hypothetical protein